MSLSFGHLGSQTRSVGRIKGIPSGHSRKYDLCSVDQISSQLGKKCGLTVFAQLTRKIGRIHFVGEMTQVIQGHHSPLIQTMFSIGFCLRLMILFGKKFTAGKKKYLC